MTPVGLMAAALRVVAVLIVLVWLREIARLIGFSHAETYAVQWWLVASLSVLALCAAGLFWCIPRALARRLVGGLEPNAPSAYLTDAQLMEVGITLLGLFLLFGAASDIVYWSVWLTIILNADPLNVRVNADPKANMVVTVVEFLLALFLTFRAGWSGRAILRVRYAGVDKNAS